jgi:hypothetical protein
MAEISGKSQTGWQRLGWFLLIWLASVLALGLVAGLLRLLMYGLGMRVA